MKKFARNLVLVFIFVFFCAFTFVGCGDNDNSSSNDTTTADVDDLDPTVTGGFFDYDSDNRLLSLTVKNIVGFDCEGPVQGDIDVEELIEIDDVLESSMLWLPNDTNSSWIATHKDVEMEWTREIAAELENIFGVWKFIYGNIEYTLTLFSNGTFTLTATGLDCG